MNKTNFEKFIVFLISYSLGIAGAFAAYFAVQSFINSDAFLGIASLFVALVSLSTFVVFYRALSRH